MDIDFFIIKSDISFCFIGSDHALEQENVTMKLTRGAIGLTQNQAVLHHFCLAAPFLSALSKEFCNKNYITKVYYSQHY